MKKKISEFFFEIYFIFFISSENGFFKNIFTYFLNDLY